MVDVPAVVEVLIFVMVRDFVDPVASMRPSMVTLSAPFRSIKGAPAMVPLIVLAEPVG